VASLSQGRTAAAQCGLFTHKSVPVIFEPPCTWGKLVAESDCCLSSALNVNLGGHKFKEIREVKTDVSPWLVTLDTDFYQQRAENPVSRHGKCLSYGGTMWKKSDITVHVYFNCFVESANKEHEMYPSYTYFLIDLRTYYPLPMHHVGSRSYSDNTRRNLKINTRWQWMVSLTLRTLLPWGCIALYMYCRVDLNSLTSVRKSDGEMSCPCWESNACFAVISQCARTNIAKQKSRMEALLWYATTIRWWWVMYDNVGQITSKLFHPFKDKLGSGLSLNGNACAH